MMNEDYAKSLVSLAKELGADDAIPFAIDDIAFDARTILKCLYGCSGGHGVLSHFGHGSSQYNAVPTFNAEIQVGRIDSDKRPCQRAGYHHRPGEPGVL